MKGLIAHCGANHVSLEDIRNLPTPAPLGPRHQPIPFADFIDEVHTSLHNVGFEVVEQAFAVYRDERLFGVLQVNVPNLHGDDSYGFMVGLRGSHDQSMSRGLSVGSRVFVCDNMAFSGDHVIRTKQTLRVSKRMPTLIGKAVQALPGFFADQARLFDTLRVSHISDTQADALITECVRRNVVPPTAVSRLIQEWDNPSHEEHAEDGLTLWRLHNAVTETLKPINPDRSNLNLLQARTLGLTHLLSEASKSATQRVFVEAA